METPPSNNDDKSTGNDADPALSAVGTTPVKDMALELELARRIVSFAELEGCVDALDSADCEAMLRDGRAAMRANGLRALAVLGTATPGMVPLLRDGEEAVARAAADALDRLGVAMSELIPGITQALDGVRPVIRELVLDTLAGLVGRADDALIAALDGPPESTRDAAVEAPLRAGRPGVLLLARALSHEKTLVRYNSARGLCDLAGAGLFARLGVDRRIVETLVSVRDTDDAADVRAAADDALSALLASEREQAQILAQQAVAEAAEIAIDGFTERILTSAALAEAMREDDKARALAALRDGRLTVRANAARALAALGAERAGDTVQALAVLLRDGESAVRLAAVEALGALRPAALAVAENLVTALGDRDRTVSKAAYRALAGLGDQAVPAVLAGFGNERRQHAHKHLFALVAAHPEAVELLSQAFLDPRVDVQVMTARALAHLGPERIGAGRRVLEAARTGGHARTREAVHEALAALTGPSAPGPAPGDVLAALIPGFAERRLTTEEMQGVSVSADQLAAALGDGRPLVRDNAARALSALGAPAVGYARLLIVLLRDSEPQVGMAAARALTDLGTAIAEAVPDLAQALDGVDSRVRESALTLLAGLVGRADEALVAALNVAPESLGQDAVVEALARAGRTGALVLSRALSAPQTLIRYNSAKGLQRVARSGVLANFLLDAEIVDALESVRANDDASDVRAAATLALSALLAAREDAAAADKARAAAEAAQVPIAGFADAPIDTRDLRARLADPDSGLSAAQLRPRLVVALRDGRPQVRANAARALTTLGPDDASGSVRAISVLLRDAEPTVRLAAARALDGLRPASAEVAAALVAALGDRHERISDAAYSALAGLGQSAVLALIDGLASERRESGRDRMLALIHARPNAVEVLSRAFLDPRVDVQVSAALGLGRLGPQRVGVGRRVLEAARTGGDARTRSAVRAALVMLDEGRPLGPSPADLLAGRITGFTDRVLPLDSVVVEPGDMELVASALGDGRASVRANAASALAGLGPAAAAHTRLLIVLLRDSDSAVGLAAARALTILGVVVAPVIPAMAQALDGVHPRVREQVLELMVALVGRTDDALISALDVSPESFGQDAVVEALVRAGRPGALVLARALTQEQTLVRYNSAKGIQRIARAGALSEMGVDVKIVESLEVVCTGDDASDVRAAAGLALSAIDAARRQEVAQRAVQMAAQAASVGISGFSEWTLSDEELARHEMDLAERIERIALALQDGRPIVRQNAARLLARGPERRARTSGRAIAVLLRDAEVDVRRAAIDALIALGERTPAATLEVADTLVASLSDSDARVSGGASFALRELGDSAIGALMRGLDTDHPAHVRRVTECIHALADAERVLCQAFASPSATVRVNAAQGLAGLGHERVTTGRQVLEAARTGGDAATRAAVRAALVALAPPAPAGPKEISVPGFHERTLSRPESPGDVDPASLLAALGDPRPITRANSATFLPAAELSSADTVSALSVLMRDGEPRVRAAAAAALGTLGENASAGAEFLVLALADEDRQVVAAARQSLTTLGSAAVPALARGLETDVREHASHVLALVTPLPDADQLLSGWFTHGSEFVRANAARGLGLLGPSVGESAKNLLEAARTSASKRVRSAVGEALAMLTSPDEPGPPAIEIPGFHERMLAADELPVDALAALDEASLLAALGDGKSATRANALTALTQLGERAIPHLRLIAVLLRDSELPVALAAARALKSLGARVADIVPSIARARDDAHPEIGERVIDILSELVGKADDALVAALDVSPELGQDAVVEGMVRAGRAGALLLVRALLVERTLERFNSARGIERLARRGALTETGVDREILRALSTVRYTDDATDVRTAAAAAIAAVMAAQAEHAAAVAAERAREASAIAIPGFAERSLSIEELAGDELSGQVSPDNTERFTLALRDGNPLVRANAARALAALGPARAGHSARAISVLLRDSEAAVRRAAATSLAALEYGAQPVADALVAALGSDDPGVYEPAGAALRGLGERVRESLRAGLATGSRAHALRIIACIHELSDSDALLAQAFSDPSVDIQVNAALGLGLLGRERVGAGLALLEAARTGGDGRTRAAVREALDMLAPPAGAGPQEIAVAGFHERVLPAAELAEIEIPLASLLAAMNDIRPVVRANTATALGAQAGTAGHFLAILLRDGEPLVRAAAARALANPELWSSAEFGAGEGVLQGLVAALGDADPSVVDAAESALKARGEDAMDALYRGLATDSRRHAARICGLIHLADDPVIWLTLGLRDPSVDVQVNAARGLGMLGPDRIGDGREVLESARTGGDRRTRVAVREALAAVTRERDSAPPAIEIGGFHARILSPAELASESVAIESISIDSILFALRDGRVPTRANGAALLALTGAAAEPHVHALAVLLRDSSTEVRLAAARALADLGELAATEADVLVAALGDRDTRVASAASSALEALGDSVQGALIRGLASDSPRQVYGVLGLIHKLDDPVEVLCDAFTSDEVDVQINAAIGLGRLGPERVGKGLDVLRVARTGGDRRTRAAVRDVLLMLDPPSHSAPEEVTIAGFYERELTTAECAPEHQGSISVEALFDALKDGRDLVRANAVTALGARADDSVVLPMSVLLRDSSPSARAATARALGQLGAAAVSVADALAAALCDRDEGVVTAALATLRDLGTSVAPALIRALDTDDEAHADRLLRLLEPLANAPDLLFEAFQSPALHSKINAAHGLGMLGRERVGAQRIDVLDDEQWHGDLRKRMAIRRALRALSN